MASDVVINIFGDVQDVDVLSNLARTGALEGGIDWNVEATTEEMADFILEMAESGEPVTLVANDVRRMDEMFPQVRHLARNSGLSYALVFGAAGEEGYETGISWRHGLVEEQYFNLGDDSEPTVSLAHLKDAYAAGPEAVAALIVATQAKAEAGAISVHPDVVEAYRGAATPVL